MNYNDVYLNKMLSDYKNRLQQQKDEYKKLPPGRLGVRNQAGRRTYMQMIAKSPRAIIEPKEMDSRVHTYIRKGITKDEDLIKRLARKKFLEISIELLNNEISRLEDFIDEHMEPTPALVLDTLPEAYRHLPETMFFSKDRATDDWANEKYPQNGYNPHEKKHITSKGLRVRSKSELVIAERLYANNIPFRYEQLIHIENHTFSPDFTFNREGRLYFWEHCGMMDNKRYRNNNKWKLSMYEKADIVPWKNLIVTYDMADGSVNTAIIESEIVNKLRLDSQ